MYAGIDYPYYSLEIFMSLDEKNSLVRTGGLEGEVKLLLRVFPAFKEGVERFIYENAKLRIKIGEGFSLNKNKDIVDLVLDKKKVTTEIEDYICPKYHGGGVYFNIN